jgi:hypothetical protein
MIDNDRIGKTAIKGDVLIEAVNKFAVSYCAGLRTEDLFMTWGNALLALGKFDAAVEKFRLAGDVAPTNDSATLNIAMALLRKTSEGKQEGRVTEKEQLEAIRAVADHLSWSSTGGRGTPYQPLIGLITGALDDGERDRFMVCTKTPLPNLSQEGRGREDAQHHLRRAQLKICVDALRDHMAGRIPGAYKN